MRLAPDYAGAILQRSKVYLYYLGAAWDGLTHEQRLFFARLAFQDSDRCMNLEPTWAQAWLIHFQNIVYCACIESLPEKLLYAGESMNALLQFDAAGHVLSVAERAFAVNIRAQCNHFLGSMAAAEKDYNASINLAPDQPRWYLNRAQYWEHAGWPLSAAADRWQAQVVRDRVALRAH